MKVVYRGRRATRWGSTGSPVQSGDVLELVENNWDDYGNKTTFNTYCRINSEVIDLGQIKLMFEGVWTTSTFLDEQLAAGWDGGFPFTGAPYISVPSEISFYEQISSVLGLDQALEVARALRDASYLVNTEADADAIALTQTEAFNQSLQRERGSIKSFLDGWKFFARQAMSVLDLGFHFRDVFGQVSVLDLKYQTDGPLPHDINVLIGANGAGKSRILHQIVEDWINEPDEEASAANSRSSSFRRVISSRRRAASSHSRLAAASRRRASRALRVGLSPIEGLGAALGGAGQDGDASRTPRLGEPAGSGRRRGRSG